MARVMKIRNFKVKSMSALVIIYIHNKLINNKVSIFFSKQKERYKQGTLLYALKLHFDSRRLYRKILNADKGGKRELKVNLINYDTFLKNKF